MCITTKRRCSADRNISYMKWVYWGKNTISWQRGNPSITCTKFRRSFVGNLELRFSHECHIRFLSTNLEDLRNSPSINIAVIWRSKSCRQRGRKRRQTLTPIEVVLLGESREGFHIIVTRISVGTEYAGRRLRKVGSVARIIMGEVRVMPIAWLLPKPSGSVGGPTGMLVAAPVINGISSY